MRDRSARCKCFKLNKDKNPHGQYKHLQQRTTTELTRGCFLDPSGRPRRCGRCKGTELMSPPCIGAFPIFLALLSTQPPTSSSPSLPDDDGSDSSLDPLQELDAMLAGPWVDRVPLTDLHEKRPLCHMGSQSVSHQTDRGCPGVAEPLTPVLEYLVTEPPLKSDGTPRYAAPAAKVMLSMDQVVLRYGPTKRCVNQPYCTIICDVMCVFAAGVAIFVFVSATQPSFHQHASVASLAIAGTRALRATHGHTAQDRT